MAFLKESCVTQFSKNSLAKLETCDERLQRVFNEVVKHVDCSVLEGHRGKAEQDECCAKGLSKQAWPLSKHNATPSKAADVAPYPIDWKNTMRFTLFAGFVLGTARSMGVELRWGGDWNRNGNPSDENFLDMPHFELVD